MMSLLADMRVFGNLGEQLVEIVRFVHVWEQGDTGCKIVRALSYDHRVP